MQRAVLSTVLFLCGAWSVCAAAPLPRLRTDGTRIVDERGRAVNLRGINLGGWFVEEMWMTPWVQDPPEGSTYAKVNDSVTLWAAIRQRLGEQAARDVRTAWRETWVQPSDFPRIRAAGFNHVRIPFQYDIVDEPGGMDWLRRAVRWANDAGLYVVLDMHGAPGRQSADHVTGQAGVNKFFFNPANVARAEQVWSAIGRTFAANPGVAMLDLLNEPTGAPNPATLHVVYHRLFTAARKAAPNTILIIDDGYKGFDTTPHADVAGWTNVVYSLHSYNFDAKSTADHIAALERNLPRILELRGYRNAPVYIGEFNLEPHNAPETMARVTSTFSSHDLAWAMWTFKTVAKHGPMGYWGLYRNMDAVDPLNPFTDSVEQLKTKLQQVRTDRLAPVTEIIPIFQAGDRATPATPGAQVSPTP